MSSTPKIYLVTGANRGIGLGLVNEIVSKQPNTVVFAAARSPSDAQELNKLSAKYPGKIEVVQYLASDVDQNRAMAKIIKEKYGHLDIVIANATLANVLGTVADIPPAAWREHLDINAVGIVVLFQATMHLLKASGKPKFIPITSAVGSLTAYIDMGAGFSCYGATKATVNYIARRIHFENEWLVCFPLAPGIVDSDMARSHRVMDKSGTLASLQDAISMSPEKASTMLVAIINSSTREKQGGEYMDIDGSKLSW